MPNLAFSPGPPNPAPQQEHGGEKENASSPPAPLSGGGINKKIAGEMSAAGRSSVGSVGRSPLEDLSAPAAAVAPAAGGAVVCKRDSSCKCPDCDMAASVFGIDDLRQVGGGGRRAPDSPDAAASSPPPASGGGGLARSPLPGTGVEDAAPASPVAAEAADVVDDGSEAVTAPREEEEQAAVPPPLPFEAASPAATPSSPLAAVRGEMPAAAEEVVVVVSGESSAAGGEDTSGGAEESKPESEPEPEPEVTEGGTPAPAHGSTPAESGGSKKKGGWGFRMAHAVFSPKSPKKDKQVGGGGGGGDSADSGAVPTAFAGELEDEAGAATSAADADAAAAVAGADTPQQPSVEEEATTEAAAGEPSAGDETATVTAATGGDGRGSKTAEAAGDDDLLSDDGVGNAGEDGEEHGPVEQEEGDAVAAAVSGGTCKPPLPVDGSKNGAERSAAAVAAVSLESVLGKGAAAKKRSSSGRRLSKDIFFECSSEVRSPNHGHSRARSVRGTGFVAGTYQNARPAHSHKSRGRRAQEASVFWRSWSPELIVVSSFRVLWSSSWCMHDFSSICVPPRTPCCLPARFE